MQKKQILLMWRFFIEKYSNSSDVVTQPYSIIPKSISNVPKSISIVPKSISKLIRQNPIHTEFISKSNLKTNWYRIRTNFTELTQNSYLFTELEPN